MKRVAPVYLGSQPIVQNQAQVAGRFVERLGERFYLIENASRMPPFFTCIVSEADHWLYASSNGCLTAGRRNSKNALFPYVTEDKIRDNVTSTGPFTALLVEREGRRLLWRPFRSETCPVYSLRRNLYKNLTGNKIGFEEINETLGLGFSYEWCTSARYGFVRRARLHNLGDSPLNVEMMDGLLNLLPAGTNEQLQLGFSCLIDAYKMSEQVTPNGLATFCLASRVTDRPEPQESLRATIAHVLGLNDPEILLCDAQIGEFVHGHPIEEELEVRGRRCAYLAVDRLRLPAASRHEWTLLADVERTQADVVSLAQQTRDPQTLAADIERDVSHGTATLRGIVADTDGLQLSADEATTAHHFANTLFNDMRGGVYADGYRVRTSEFIDFVRATNKEVFETQLSNLQSLPSQLEQCDLRRRMRELAEPDLERMSLEYLPLTFGRRHGDPSRPWNEFDIKVRDDAGNRLRGFQGNWRDIFQNWEALCLSYPGYTENMVAKFVNASTVDGYNPYRITDRGIDWEVPEPDNPWAGIGYWGDHQIIYLLKLLELSRAHHPSELEELLLRRIFSYANVPYRIEDYENIKRTPRNTIEFDQQLHERILDRERSLGSDGRLLLRPVSYGAPEVVRVTLLEKLLVASLAKMANYVPGGGIWLNTQRPEWNDANNALVGRGVSMVTLYYLTRYFAFVDDLVAGLNSSEVELSAEVATWLQRTTAALAAYRCPENDGIDERDRFQLVETLGRIATDYRARVYQHGLSDPVPVKLTELESYLGVCREHLASSMRLGRREDGLYHAYNLLRFRGERLEVGPLQQMLEGQVAALSAGTMPTSEVIQLLTRLRNSAMYRGDQNSYMLYPDRQLPGFLEKNRIPEAVVSSSELLSRLVDSSSRIAARDANGVARFGAELLNVKALDSALREEMIGEGQQVDEEQIQSVLDAYEAVFSHDRFTGRSGTMFGYEGLGSIYWHMVAKLLLAVQENYFWAEDRGAEEEELHELQRHYYQIRNGLGGFNKTPDVYGAFVVDPYSHTPEGGGARQPGMTGQVKEEILTRFGELGVRIRAGRIRFDPSLLRPEELLKEPAEFEWLDVRGTRRTLGVPAGALAFTFGGVPVVLHGSRRKRLCVTTPQGQVREQDGTELSNETSNALFRRSGDLERLDVWAPVGRTAM